MGGTYKTNVRGEKIRIRFWSENVKVRDYLEDCSMILEWNLEK